MLPADTYSDNIQPQIQVCGAWGGRRLGLGNDTEGTTAVSLSLTP